MVDNRIVAENARLDGVQARSYWDAATSTNIEGFATDISVNAGNTVNFKINVNDAAGSDYRVEIFRLGYYDGSGAREVTEWRNTSATVQVAALQDRERGLVDAGNWTITDSWNIPADAVSGVYIARLQRLDDGGNPIAGQTNQIPFVVRNDGVAADIVLQTSDTTWQAYNGWGGNNGAAGANFYGDRGGVADALTSLPGAGTFAQDRAYAVSYNRPFITRDGDVKSPAAGAQDYLFGADYAAISFLEKNGYSVSYISGVDTDRLGPDYLKNYKAFISVGHDEYWSGNQRSNVEAARDAGVNLLFWSGNEVYWKTRWENSISADGTPFRTLVCYKETWANGHTNALPSAYNNIDPSNEWTGTWRDLRFVDSVNASGVRTATGQIPENALTGQLFGPDGNGEQTSLDVPSEYGGLRVWRDTAIAGVGADLNLYNGILGYEWNTVPDDEYRPDGLVRLSLTTRNWGSILIDEGNATAPGVATHSLSLYRDPQSNALVFGSGTTFWTWGLSNEHDSSPYGATIANSVIQQFTLNMFADMGIQPGVNNSVLASQGLVRALASADVTPASVTLNALADTVSSLSTVVISGTATDNDNNLATSDGVVALVEVSLDNGVSWNAAQGTTNWTYAWQPTLQDQGRTITITARAIDDSLNLPTLTAPPEVVTVTPPVRPAVFSLFDAQVPANAGSFNDNEAIEVGMKFNVTEAGEITELKYYRAASDAGDTDVREGHLWRVSDGQLLATVTFTSGIGQSGWQVAQLSSSVAIAAGTDYVVSYRSLDNYVATSGFFSPTREVAFDGIDNDAFGDPFGVISAPQNSVIGDAGSNGNGLYRYGTGLSAPTETFQSANYWVDVTFDPTEGPNDAPIITSNGGDATATIQIPENTTFVTDVNATDANALVYSLAGGADAAKFTINAGTGFLSFINAPNFEIPGSAAGTNQYQVIVRASDGALADTQALTVNVTDVAGDPTTSQLFSPNETPGAAPNDPTSYELGTRFFSTQDGFITALQYYRGTGDAADTDTRTLNLWTAAGQNLGSVQVISATGQAGWQIGTLSSAVAITANTAYVVSYGFVYDGVADFYAFNSGYFNTAHTGSDGILTAYAGNNGVLAIGTPGTFPTSTFNNTNYWTDVVFDTVGNGGGNTPPVFTSGNTFLAAENQVLVGTATATDAQSSALTFGIANGDDGALFRINPTTGLLQFRAPQDFETRTSFTVNLTAFDGTATTTQAVTVNLANVNETVNGTAAFTGASLTANYVFGTAATDIYAGAGATQTATVNAGVEFANLPNAGSDVGNGAFGLASVDVSAQTIRIEFPLDDAQFPGFLRFAGPADGKPFNGVQLVDGSNNLPTILSARVIGQEGMTNQTGGLLAVTDADLTVTSDSIFLNVQNKGRLTDINPDQAGSQHSYVTLLVDLNDAPVITSNGGAVSAAINVAENTTLVTTLAATDADTGQTISYTLAGEDAGLFQIVAGEVRFILAPNAEALPVAGVTPGYQVTIEASDAFGGADSQAVTVTITDVNETGVTAPVDTDAASNTVLENATAGTLVGITASASDADATTNAVTYSLTNTAGGRFAINATTGVVTVAAAAVLDFETAASHGITVRATSQDGSFSDTAFTVSVGDVAEGGGVVLNGSSAANTLTGGEGSDTINGNGGNDTLSGLGGGDIINGGSGSDLVNAGSGNDTLDGGTGIDILNGNGDNDVFLIRGADAAADQMNGGDGIDTIRVAVGSGTVTLYAVAANDIENFDGSGQIIQGSSAANVLNFSGFSNVVGVAEIRGLSGTDQITGTSGADVMDGGVSQDTLIGGGGDDTFIIRNGDASTDVMAGGLGTDTIRVAADSGIVTLGQLTAGDIEIFDGSGRVVQGTSTANVFDLSGFLSVINLAELRGLGGNDRLTGSAGGDVMDGGIGNDTLIGGNGNDNLIGGAGSDELTGGLGSDSFVFNALASATRNLDKITDFVTGSDRLVFDDAFFTSLISGGGGALDAAQFHLGATAAAADDRLIYNQLTGALFYDSDGLGGLSQVQVASLTGNPVLAATDIFLI